MQTYANNIRNSLGLDFAATIIKIGTLVPKLGLDGAAVNWWN